jgi:hypothetical protein
MAGFGSPGAVLGSKTEPKGSQGRGKATTKTHPILNSVFKGLRHRFGLFSETSEPLKSLFYLRKSILFGESSFSLPEPIFDDLWSIFGPFLKPKASKNRPKTQRRAEKKPSALGRRLESVLASILAVKVENTRLPSGGLAQCAAPPGGGGGFNTLRILGQNACGQIPAKIPCEMLHAMEFVQEFMQESCIRSARPQGAADFNRYAHSADPSMEACMLRCTPDWSDGKVESEEALVGLESEEGLVRLESEEGCARLEREGVNTFQRICMQKY